MIGVFLGAGSFLTLAAFFGVAVGLATLLSDRLRLDGDGFLGVLSLACWKLMYSAIDGPDGSVRLTTY